MRRSILFKLFFGYFAIILALSALILFFSFRIIRAHYIETLAADLENLTVALKLEIKPLMEKGDPRELDDFVKDIGEKLKTRITVVHSSGIVLADSENDPKLMGNHGGRPEIAEAMKGTRGMSLRFSRTVRDEMLYVAVPLDRDGNIEGALRVSLFLKDIDRFLAGLRKNIIRIALVFFALSLLGIFLYSRRVSNAIGRLTAASRRIASGDFTGKVVIDSEDELKELADHFNLMNEEMKRIVAELSHQKEELNSIVSSIQGGLCLLDKDGKIVLSNKSFKGLAESEEIEGKYYWEVLREPKLGELINNVREEKRNIIDEVPLGDRTLLCSANLLNSRESMIIILHDVTEMKNIEKMKKDFVTNVSHELRTPLTAIKGYVET